MTLRVGIEFDEVSHITTLPGDDGSLGAIDHVNALGRTLHSCLHACWLASHGGGGRPAPTAFRAADSRRSRRPSAARSASCSERFRHDEENRPVSHAERKR